MGGGQFSQLLAAEVCASAVVMLDTPCSEAECKTTGYHSTRMFPLHFPYRVSLCAIRFQLSSTDVYTQSKYKFNETGFFYLFFLK